MLPQSLNDLGVIIVSTGNVLNVSDLRKKAGQKPTDEVSRRCCKYLRHVPRGFEW